MDRPRRRPTRLQVAVVSLGATAVALYSVLVPLHATLYASPLPVVMLLGGGMCAAPLIALRMPRTSLVLFAATAFLLPLIVPQGHGLIWPWPWSVPALIAFAVQVGVITFLHGWRLGVVQLAVGVGGSLVADLLLPDAASAEAVGADLIVAASIATFAHLAAILAAGRVRVGEELTRERELTALEHSRRLMVEERTRIARELHDVVAHSMSLIQVQASTARYRLPDLADDAAVEFDDIAATARGSLTEMRRLLGVLRTEDQVAEHAPQQGIGDIPALVEGIRRAGADVALHIDELPALPAAVEIAAFRITQEALSNAVRHAPGSFVDVAVTASGGAVHLRVRNSFPGDQVGTRTPHGTGHGLLGMRERAALLHGSLSAGPAVDGSWTVTAVLPWTDDPDGADQRARAEEST